MYRYLLFVLLLVLNLALWLGLSGHIPANGESIPPIGKLLHPHIGLWANGVSPSAAADETLEISGLAAVTQIHYDERGVPHIYAESMLDAITVMGYCEARDRAFQLDFTARAASGRLSEIVGAATVPFDKKTLRNGMVYAAEQSYDKAKDLLGFEYLEAYSRGINSYLASLDYASQPIEAKILNYTIEPWSPLKSQYVTAYMSEYLNHMYDDLENSNLLTILGDSLYHDLYPSNNTLTHPITYGQAIPDGEILDASQVTNAVIRDTFVDTYYRNPDEGLGSNAWAVNAALSATGNPLYASDPHLNLSLPSIWYELQIHTPTTHVHGVKIVGVPGIMIGFNDHIAWGETNVGHDQSDLYLIKWTDNSRSHYLLDGDTVAIEYRVETIPVKGGSAVIDTVRYTHWGPILHHSTDGQHDLAQRWIVHDGADSDESRTFVDMMSATGYSDYINAANHYSGPPQNFNMASKNDTIAIRINGVLPLRSMDDGRYIEDGSQRSNGWQDIIPRSHNPLIVNPSSGYVSSSNQRSTDDTYPYYYHGRFSDYRNRAIDTVLSQAAAISVADMMALQHDSYSVEAVDILPTMLSAMATEPRSPAEQSLLELLTIWDHRYTSDSRAATLFDRWLAHIYDETWDEIDHISQRMDVRYPEMFRTIELIKQEAEHIFFDLQTTAQQETASDIIRYAWKKAYDEVKDLSPEQQQWGQYKPMSIRHLARIPGMGVDSIITDGCTTCINANGRTMGASWRMIVDLGDTVRAKAIYPGGQSGNPLSPLYTTGIQKWAAGEYYDILLHHSPESIPDIRQTITIKSSE